MTQRFDIYFKRRDDSFTKFGYDGQVELDYTIWTESRVLVVEAKSLTRGGFDIGWHKLAYPAHRFHKLVAEDELKINPVYFLRTVREGANVILIFLFKEMEFRDGGIVLNDKSNWEVLKVFRVNIRNLDRKLLEGSDGEIQKGG